MPIDNALERKIGPHGVAAKALHDALGRAGGALDGELAKLAGEPSFGGKTIRDLAAAEGRASAETLARNGCPVRTIHKVRRGSPRRVADALHAGRSSPRISRASCKLIDQHPFAQDHRTVACALQPFILGYRSAGPKWRFSLFPRCIYSGIGRYLRSISRRWKRARCWRRSI